MLPTYRLRTIKDLEPGDHLCCLYETEEQRLALLQAFIQDGLEAGDKIIYIMDKDGDEQAVRNLQMADDIERYLANGTLTFLSIDETYMQNDVFEPRRVMDMLQSATDRALAEGYSALRITGGTGWAQRGAPGSEHLLEYERSLEPFFARNKCIAICQYDQRTFDPDRLLSVLASHPTIVVGTELYDNLYYIPPAKLQDTNHSKATLQNWLKNLEQRKQAEQALRESEKRFYQAFHANPGIISISSLDDGRILEVNHNFLEIFGYSDKEVLGHTSRELNIWADLADRERLVRALLKEGSTRNKEVKLRKKSGETLDVLSSSEIIELNGKKCALTILYDITDRKKAEETLTKLSSAVEQTADNVFITNKDGIIEYVNPAFEQLTGYAKKEVVGKTPRILKSGKHEERFYETLWQTILSGEAFREVFVNRKKSGEVYYEQKTLSPIRDGLGNITHFVSTGKDITERMRIEFELYTRVHQQAVVAEMGQRALAGMDLSGLMNGAVPLVAETLDVEYVKVLELMPDGEELLLRAGIGWKEGQVGKVRVKAKTNSQAGYTLLSTEPVVVEDLHTESRFSGPPLLTEHGVVSGVSVIIHGRDRPFGILGAHTSKRRLFSKDDINFLQAMANVLAEAIERQKVEQALRDSEARFRTTFERTAAGMAITDTDGRFLRVNAAFCKFLNYEMSELLKLKVSDVTHHKDRAKTLRQFKEVLSGQRQVIDLEKRYVRKEGGIMWGHTNAVFLFDPDKHPSYCVAVIQDITQRKLAQEALQESETRYRGVVESSAEAIFIEQDARLVYVNPAGLALLGHADMTELNGRTMRDLFDEEGENPLDKFPNTQNGPPSLFDGKLIAKNGDVKDVELTFIETVYQGRPAIQAVARDITETKKLRQVAQRMERLAAIGQLSASIAHEIRNPLGSIGLNLDNLLGKLEIPSNCTRIIQNIEYGLARIQSIITGVLNFASPVPPKLVRANVHHAITMSIYAIQSEFEQANIRILKRLEARQPNALIDSDQIMQVFVNLLSNAADSIGNGGEVVIRTSCWENGVEVQIADSGKGIPPEQLKRIFDPFFTTKRGGIGLGMAIVSRIVEQHRANISVESKVNVGTKFTIRLPAA